MNLKEWLKNKFGVEATDEQISAAESEINSESKPEKTKQVQQIQPVDKSENSTEVQDLKRRLEELTNSNVALVKGLNEQRAAEKARQDKLEAEAKVKLESDIAAALKNAAGKQLIPTDKESEMYKHWETLLRTDFETANALLFKGNPITNPPAEGEKSSFTTTAGKAITMQGLKQNIAASIDAQIGN